jgi:hypothetical protein
MDNSLARESPPTPRARAIADEGLAASHRRNATLSREHAALTAVGSRIATAPPSRGRTTSISKPRVGTAVIPSKGRQLHDLIESAGFVSVETGLAQPFGRSGSAKQTVA